MVAQTRANSPSALQAGALSFVTAPNFELPADGGIDNQTIAVTISDADGDSEMIGIGPPYSDMTYQEAIYYLASHETLRSSLADQWLSSIQKPTGNPRNIPPR